MTGLPQAMFDFTRQHVRVGEYDVKLTCSYQDPATGEAHGIKGCWPVHLNMRPDVGCVYSDGEEDLPLGLCDKHLGPRYSALGVLYEMEDAINLDHLVPGHK